MIISLILDKIINYHRLEVKEISNTIGLLRDIKQNLNNNYETGINSKLLLLNQSVNEINDDDY